MKWTGMRRSANVDDRRGAGGVGRGFGGGFGGLGGGMGRGMRLPLSGGGIVVLLLIVAITVFAGDPFGLAGGGSHGARGTPDAAQDALADMTSVVLASTEDVWRDQFAKRGAQYAEPRLVLFDYEVGSACGFANAAVGPFYCSRDDSVYLDLSFFDELSRRFGAPGDFAQAYVIAHEVGHHVQNQLGVTNDVAAAQQRLSEGQANALSVRLELQADFYAGVWAYHAQRTNPDLLEAGDLDEALNAATAIGDDRLQKEAQGRVVPDSFTHGTSEQRTAWFRKGFESGKMEEGDTFGARDLARP